MALSTNSTDTADLTSLANLQAQLEKQLAAWFPGSETELEVVPLSEKVGGFLIWDDFSGQPQKQRQAALWDHIRTLRLEDQLQISAIFTVTKDELTSMRENE